MANEQNLKPFIKGEQRQKELGKNGGIKSGEVRREKKLWKEEIIKKLNATDWNEIVDTLIKNARENGGKDFEILRDTMGQKPKEELNIETKIADEYDDLSLDEMRELLKNAPKDIEI